MKGVSVRVWVIYASDIIRLLVFVNKVNVKLAFDFVITVSESSSEVVNLSSS